MDGCVWFGADADGPSGRRNELDDNDFTQVLFGENVAWRSRFPLARQRFPEGFVPRVDDEDPPA